MRVGDGDYARGESQSFGDGMPSFLTSRKLGQPFCCGMPPKPNLGQPPAVHAHATSPRFPISDREPCQCRRHQTSLFSASNEAGRRRLAYWQECSLSPSAGLNSAQRLINFNSLIDTANTSARMLSTLMAYVVRALNEYLHRNNLLGPRSFQAHFLRTTASVVAD